MDFSTIKNTSKKERGNNMNFSTSQLHRKKVCGNNLDFSTIENTLKKVRQNNVDFSTSEITSKKLRGNDVDFSISKITSKKYVEMTWKFVQICSLTNRRNIDVESISVRRGVPVGNTFQCFMALPLWNPFLRLCDLGKFNYSSLILKNDRLSLYNTIYIFLKFIRAICK